MIVSHGVEDQAGSSFSGPAVQILLIRPGGRRFSDHGYHALMPGAFADPFQFFVAAEFVGTLPFRQALARPGKIREPVFS
jgi:hypothetical protein